MAGKQRSTRGLECRPYWWGDIWNGTAEQLIEAGIIRREQLPGEPGNSRYTMSYFNGQPVPKGANRSGRDGYLSICRSGKWRYEVRVKLPKRELGKRETQLTVDEARLIDPSVPDPAYTVGDSVDVRTTGTMSVATIRSLKWGSREYLDSTNNTSPPGWLYVVDPNPSDKYGLHWESALHRRKPAVVLYFPTKLSCPVRQGKPRGPRPKAIAQMDRLRPKWESRKREVTELEQSISYWESAVTDTEKVLASKRSQLEELLSRRF